MADVAAFTEGNKANNLKEKKKYYFKTYSISKKKNYVVDFNGSLFGSQTFVVDHQHSVADFKMVTD